MSLISTTITEVSKVYISNCCSCNVTSPTAHVTRSSATAEGPSDVLKGFPYSLPSVGPGADPGVQAVSPQVTVSHPPGGRLPLLPARPVVTFPATEHHLFPKI